AAGAAQRSVGAVAVAHASDERPPAGPPLHADGVVDRPPGLLGGGAGPPRCFSGERLPSGIDCPSIPSIVGDALPARNNNLPPAVVLPERLVHWSGGVIPGAYGGTMGARRDPFFIETSPYGDPMWRGAYPEYTFPNQSRNPPANPDDR